MAERWRKPVVPLAVEEHPTQAIYLPDGRQLGDVMFVLSEEDKERLRLGRVCIKCFEPFEVAWPERCSVCGAPIRSEQAAFFAQEVGEPVHLGPTTTLEEERAGIYERLRKKEESNGS